MSQRRLFRAWKKFRDFNKDRSGNTLMIFALSIIPLAVVVGLAMDYGRAATTRAEMAKALDGALLYAAQKITLDPTLDVKTAVENTLTQTLNFPASYNMTVTGQKLPNNRLEAAVSITLPTTMMNIAGVADVDIQVKSEVSAAATDLEVALVLDNTGSMSGSKITTLKTAAKNLINKLLPANNTPDNIKIGIVPFARYVNVGTANSGASWLQAPASGTWGGCVASRDDPYNKQDGNYSVPVPAVSDSFATECPTPITPLSDNATNLTTAIDAMGANGWTYIPGGLVWGWRVLTQQDPFSQGAPSTNTKVKRAIVLMTDGANTKSPNVDGSGNSLHEGSDISLSNSNLAEVCTNIKAASEDIHIYTIAFSVTDTTIKNLLQNCATTPTDYYDATNAASLVTAFANITISLKNLRLTK